MLKDACGAEHKPLNMVIELINVRPALDLAAGGLHPTGEELQEGAGIHGLDAISIAAFAVIITHRFVY